MAKFEKDENVSVSSIVLKELSDEAKSKPLYVSIFDNGVYLQFFEDRCSSDNIYFTMVKNKVVKESVKRNATELYISVY